jgi:hypothetical protein
MYFWKIAEVCPSLSRVLHRRPTPPLKEGLVKTIGYLDELLRMRPGS